MFENWIHISDTIAKKGIKPKDNQRVLVRTVHNEIWICTFERGDDIFHLAYQWGNFPKGVLTINDILQWHPIPGDE